YVAIDALVSDKANRGEDFKSSKEFEKQVRSTAFASRDDENNELSKKISGAIGAVEKQIRPHLRRS
ncbi:MAG: hypothetical protein ACXWEV_02640, partial [Methylobacter sp.]